MNSIKYLFSLVVMSLMLPLVAQAADDPVIVEKVTFKKLQQSDIPSSEGLWTRVEVLLNVKSNPDDKSNNDQWVRNVDVGLTVVYLDAKAADKKSPESMLVMKAKARLFAAKVNSKTPVVFYIPAEAYYVYRLNPEPFAYSIDLAVNTAQIQLNKDNYKKMLSATIAKSSNVAKVLESYKALVEKAGKTNDGVLIPLPLCPFNVQWYEYNGRSGTIKVPTYIVEK